MVTYIQFFPSTFLPKKLCLLFRRVFAQLAKIMVVGDLAAKETKDNDHARQRSTGRLGGCSAAKQAQDLPGEWPFGVFL